MKPNENIITNDDINKLIVESTHPMNSLNIVLPYSYISKTIALNWHDILFLIDTGYLNYQVAIEHAQFELENDGYPKAVLDLACLFPAENIFPHSIHPYIDELASMVCEEEKSKAKDKAIYILLKWIYEHRKAYEDVFNVLTIICDDFGFPETITHFAWYVSVDEFNDLGSAKENKDRWLGYWKQFLDDQHAKWKIPCIHLSQ